MKEANVKIITEIMNDRSSVRKYKTGVEIPKDTLDHIFELGATAPSSWNLQHWKFIVVQSHENKERLHKIAYYQEQMLQASAIIIVLGDKKANENANKVYAEAVRAGFMTEEAKEQLVNNINSAYEQRENFDIYEAIRNTSLASMQLMLVAKAHGIDSCPIGGFDPDALIKEFNIPGRYVPVMLMTLGYAEKPAHKTSRFSLEDIIIKESF